MSTLSVSNITDGTTTVGTSYVVNGSAKAWVNLNGAGTIAARDSFNVASLTDNGSGNYSVNVSSAFSSANHSPTVSGACTNGRTTVLALSSLTFASGSMTISASSWTAGIADFAAGSYNADTEYFMTNSHGDLA